MVKPTRSRKVDCRFITKMALAQDHLTQIRMTAIMSTPILVTAFYERIWNAGDLGAASELLIEDFSFRGSLGAELRGREAFKEYVRSVRGALASYRCEILTCVSEGERAFAKLRFSGLHVAPFRGYQATGLPVQWLGAALFRFEGLAIAELWVLGDLAGLDEVLKNNQLERFTVGSN
jgi:predicted ester cyclase